MNFIKFKKSILILNFVIVTENEIQHGVLDAENVENNVIYFERNLINYEKLGNKQVMSKFFDLDSSGNIDIEAEEMLNELKNVKIRNKLPPSNVFEFKVLFNH